MAISNRAKEITDGIYRAYGSGSGYLFGIPPEHRLAIESIVQVVLDRCDAQHEPSETEQCPFMQTP